MATGYLVEVDSTLRPRNWSGQSTIFSDSTTIFADSTSVTPASSTGTYVAELSRRVLLVTSVTEDGVVLNRRAAPSLVSANAGSWHWSGATHRLWVRTTDDGQALGHRLLATVVDGFKLGDGPAVYLRSGVPVAYEGRITALPDVSLTLQTDDNDPVLGAVVSLGELALDNHDGLIEEWLAERLIVGRGVRAYRGALGDPTTPTGPEVTSLDLWLAALIDSLAPTSEVCRLTLMPRSRALAASALASTFDLVTYPDMDPEIAGLAIPRVYGRVLKATAFRIASGRWKVADHAIGDLYAVVTAADAVAPILTESLELGEFTVDVAYDGEARLYVDLDGSTLPAPGPGVLLRQILLDTTAFTDADLDLVALAMLDTERPVRIGFQLLKSTVREALDRVARSAFADWFLTRQGLISARARIRDGRNLVTNASFETDLAGWRPLTPSISSLTRVSSGIAGPAGDWMAQMVGLVPGAGWGVGTWVQAEPGRSLSIVALASATPTIAAPQTASGFEFDLLDVDEAGFLARQTPPASVPFGIWDRAHMRVDGSAIATLHAATAASTDFFADDATFDSTGVAANVAGNLDLWVFGSFPAGKPLGPEFGIFMDDVRVAHTVQADDTNAEVTAITPEPLILWEVSVPYRVDGRTKQGPLAIAQDNAARDLYPLAESRTIEADCVDAASAQVVAEAYLAWYRSTRARTSMRLFEWERPLEPGDVIDAWHLSGTIRPPLASQLYTVVSVREASGFSGDVPTIDVEAILHFDPAVGPLVRV